MDGLRAAVVALDDDPRLSNWKIVALPQGVVLSAIRGGASRVQATQIVAWDHPDPDEGFRTAVETILERLLGDEETDG